MGEKIRLLREQVLKLYQIDFYRKKMDEVGIKPSRIKTLHDFEKIPFTSGSEILEELKKRPKDSSLFRKDVVRVNFSPSGHELYPVYQTKRDLKKMHEVCARTLRAAGVRKDDICAVTYGYHLFIAGLFYQSQLEYYGAKVIPLGPGDSERAVHLINKYDVSVLITNPTFALKLASAGLPNIRVLFVGGEPFTGIEGYPEKIKNAFGKDLIIIDSYSMALCMPIARSCRFGQGLHIMDDFIYAEVIDPTTGKRVKEGEKGELVITHLYKEASPLLRYRTGDLTYMVKEKCHCGRELTLPKGILGRTDEMLKVKGVKFWPSQVQHILRGFSEFTGKYRIKISSPLGTDRLELFVEGVEGAETRIEELSRRLKEQTLITFDKIEVRSKLEEGPSILDEREGRSF